MSKNNKNLNSSPAPKKKITKLSQLEQIDGRSEQQLSRSTKLEVLLGADGMGKYGTLDKQEYEKQLNSFNVAELRNHAIHAGLIAISDTTRLKKQLLVEFDKYTLAFNSPSKFRANTLSEEKQKIGLEILSAVK